MRAAQKLDPLKGNRAVRIDDDGAAIQWSANGAQAAVIVRSIDNKDRWIATVDLAGAKLKPVHRLTDNAWINNGNNDFGWLPDNSTLWYLSEESGYSHLYTLDGGRQGARAHAGQVGSDRHRLVGRRRHRVHAVQPQDAGRLRSVRGVGAGTARSAK